ncbi:MAG: exopolysaccharide biosynthesis polyprenyl glycosylphosphotransferase [Oscillospiraceae bacterium]|nr:exopolysaccharide biosynthesis polyprenyl glycosylphosphotransferase [Oscillospiraceae bacterium]
MKNREQYKRLIRFLATAVIIAVQTGIFYYVWFSHYDQVGANFFVRGNYVLIAQYALLVFVFNKIYSGFKVGYIRLFEVLFSHVMSVLCVNLFMYLELCLIGRWEFMSNIVPMLVMTGVDLVVALVWAYACHKLMAKLYPPKKLVLVYGKYSPDDLARKMGTRGDAYDICEKISIDEDLEVIKDRILEYHCAILTDIPDEIRNHLLKFCFENDVRCYCVPKISDIMIMHASQIQQFDTSLLLMRNQGISADQQFMKRAFDIVASVLGIILASPIMLVIALAIKLYDRGPVFFKQERLTKDGKIFKVFKFRSMRVRPKEDVYCMTRKDDDRITPVGKIIRRLHLDELPQIFNILRGEMSLVGPRPECPGVAEEYCKMMPEFNYRLKVKGGLTGYAQVYGKYNTTPYDKLKLDLTYIERYSFLLDIKLIFLTFKVLFQKDNTEGIEAWQTSAATKENLEKIEKG